MNGAVRVGLAGQHQETLEPPNLRHRAGVILILRTNEGARTMDSTQMKTTMTAVALVLALGSSAYAQEIKPSAAPSAPIAKPAEAAAKPVIAPETMQKVGAPVAPATVPSATVAPKVEMKPEVKTVTPAVAPKVEVKPEVKAAIPAVTTPAVVAPKPAAAAPAAATAPVAAKVETKPATTTAAPATTTPVAPKAAASGTTAPTVVVK